MLPPEGIKKRYPTEEGSRARLSEVRWPDGPQCPRCSGADVKQIQKRDEFACRRCRKQFSLTSGTPLHGTRISLLWWLRGAERIIEDQYSSPIGWNMTVQTFAKFLGVSYRSGFKARHRLLNDMRDGGPGFFRSLVCTEKVNLPDHVIPNSTDHLKWLFQVQTERVNERFEAEKQNRASVE
ncbi:transposase [Lentibacter sp. XHP0401]|nr:transposase [Lentibacter sp. XHP0401]